MPHVNGNVATTNVLDSADYDPITHLNAIFSHPSTLSRAPTVLRAIDHYQNDLDHEIYDQVAQQAVSDTESIRQIQTVKGELADLFSKIETVRERALETEQAITEMTADIKRLDHTKRNLTMSMTALKRLQMLTTAYEQLRGLAKTRQYKDCAQLLQAVIQLMAHFKSYRSIDQIAALSRSVADLQRELLEQVCEDFESALAKGETSQKKTMLSEACLILDALGDNAKSRLMTWYCNASLREYRQIFRANDEAGSLDNISRRYSWFNRMLKTYDLEHAAVFPPHWKVNEMLANAFCESTRDDFHGILQRAARRTDGQTIDVNLLLSCLQETLDFEHSLEKRFLSGHSRSSMDTLASISLEDKSHGFEQAISEAFTPYLSLWVEVQDKQLASMLPLYRQKPLHNPDEEYSSQMVIPSSTELFQFYRLTFAQCAKLSTGKQLLELTQTFGKYLDQYNQQVLFHFLGDSAGPQGPPVEDIIVIVNTADYCYATTTQLEEKIISRIDEEYKAKVDLQSQADSFMGLAGAGVRALVRKVETDCEAGWREMRNIAWSRLENTGDQSSYVGELIRHIRGRSEEILKLLHKPQYARAFCDNLVDALTNTYLTNITQCRPISEAGAEQMLLDFYVLKEMFLDLPSLKPESTQQPQAIYAKRVAQITSKIDPLLKTLQVRATPPEALIQAYLIHIADSSESNFRKILDMRGIARKQEQANLIEIFNAHKSSSSQTLSASSAILAQLNIPTSTQHGSSGSISVPFSHGVGSMSTPNLAGAASFGSALLTAARDGVDRLGTPSIGTTGPAPPIPASSTQSVAVSALPSRTGSPAVANVDQSTGVNDNLRSIGKFFRRDISGLGRFAAGKSSEDGK